ncbi:ATP-binding protein [Kutzneria albida]|uniref:SARP family transcription regulator n=1 Tax=Kutzneria albida DSM 43870 TaxID=1449976 RepID=W5VZX2_9PSEU|nr:tetratricopeptide repeat protein [Kutzneria albida]AHH93831.1 SARP family transcription regulator [Kutzneria albida DSM 43870]
MAAAEDRLLIRLLGQVEVIGLDGPFVVEDAQARELLCRLALRPGLLVTTDRAEAADELRVLLDKADPGGSTELLAEPGGYRLRVDPERVDVQLDEVIAEADPSAMPGCARRELIGRRMLALHRLGRRSEALAVYEHQRTGHTDQPADPELRTLYDRILYEDPALTPAVTERSRTEVVPAQLPPPPSGFTGREDELAALDQLLAEDGRPLSVVVGAAGAGKTALAVTWASRVADGFPGGQLYAGLRGFDPDRPPVEPAEVLRRFLLALGVAAEDVPVDLAERAALYRSLLTGRRVLVLLDDARDSEQVRPLLPGGAGSLVLVTSRRRLDGLVARDGAAYVPVGTLSRAQAVRLIDEVTGVRWSQHDPVNARRVAAMCGHLPLALRIVGARLAVSPRGSLARLAEELADERYRLRALHISDADEVQISVGRAFDVSYRRLAPEHAAVFRMIGLLPGSQFGPHLIAAMNSCSPASARATLRALAAAHLVTELGQDWFGMHDLVRLHSREVAATELPIADALAIAHRGLAYYCVVADRARRLIRPPVDRLAPSVGSPLVTPELRTRGQALAWFERERANLIGALREAQAAGLNDPVWRLARLLFDFLAVRCPWEDWRTSHELGLAAARAAGDQVGEALMLSGLGVLHGRLGQHERSFTEHDDCQRLAMGEGDLAAVALGAGLAGSALFHLGRHTEATQRSRQALALHRLLGDRYLQAQPLSNLGELARLRGDYRAALSCNNQALLIYEEFGDEERQAWVRVHLGETNLGAGLLDRAQTCFAEAVRLSRVCGSSLREGYALRGIGDVHLARGDKPAARAVWQDALKSFGHIGSPWVASVRVRLAKLLS